jgi:hypothetical protein
VNLGASVDLRVEHCDRVRGSWFERCSWSNRLTLTGIGTASTVAEGRSDHPLSNEAFGVTPAVTPGRVMSATPIGGTLAPPRTRSSTMTGVTFEKRNQNRLPVNAGIVNVKLLGRRSKRRCGRPPADAIEQRVVPLPTVTCVGTLCRSVQLIVLQRELREGDRLRRGSAETTWLAPVWTEAACSSGSWSKASHEPLVG